MYFEARTRNKSVKLVIKLKVSAPMALNIYAYDSDHKNSFYFKQVADLYKTDQTITINLPISPSKLSVCLFNDRNGLFGEDGFTMTQSYLEPLYPLNDYKGTRHEKFIELAEDIAKRASYLPANQIYDDLSDPQEVEIRLLSEIRDPEDGQVIPTPARVEKDKGFIEVSKQQFKSIPVPGRMMILLHEYAHFFIAQDVENEFEADYYAIDMYLNLGFPPTQAIYAFTRIFDKTEENDLRITKLDEYITNWEQTKKLAA